MTSITSLGTGSGLELESLITKLMTVEKAPLTSLQNRQTAYETKISAMGKLQSVLSSLQTSAQSLKPGVLESATTKFAAYTASVANTAVATATATTGAIAGSYSLEVSKLAQAQQLQSTAYSSSTTSITSTGGSLTLTLGTMEDGSYTADSDRSYTFNLSAGATLKDLQNAINASDAGVSATIVNGSNGAQLVLTGGEGTNNVMQLSGSGITGFDYDPNATGTQGWTQSTAAGDAEFTLNGIAVTSHSNTVTDALEGVTLELTGTTTSATTLKITEDYSANIQSALESFVSAYNKAYSTMSTLGAYDPSTKVAGDLQGNSTLRYAMNQIRQSLFGTTSGDADSAYQTLSNIGVSISASGTLSIDSTKLTAAVKADPDAVANLVANVGSKYDSIAEKLIGTDGSVTAATTGLKKTVSSLEDQQEKVQLRLESIEARYRAQFAALDTLISSLNTTGDYLTSYISSLSSKD
ncbi:MAG: flagellar filament capping protein FliD [Propionivibrio sp.]